MCVGMTDAGSEGARQAFKVVPRLQPRRRLRSAG